MAETGCRRRWLGNMGMFKTRVVLFCFIFFQVVNGTVVRRVYNVVIYASFEKHIMKSKRNFFKLPGFDVFVCNNPLDHIIYQCRPLAE